MRPAASQLCTELGRERVRDLLRDVTGEIRDELGNGDSRDPLPYELSPPALEDEIDRRLAERARRLASPSLRRVVNATGVIVHTNLGRAPLSDAALAAISEVGARYSNLEYDIESGERGHRESHCRALIARLTGAEAAAVVNNNAAAVLLVLNTLAEGGEVIVSRGELVEIGGSFRIPEVMQKSGAILREVGTTNRTRIGDYAKAICDRTRLILRVHPSNYRIIGFTERPGAAELANMARTAGIPTYEDLGSGCLTDLTSWGVTDEPLASDSLQAGISVVSFSGDKILGGPQAGIIAGSSDVIKRIRANPLMRALRTDKLAYAALEATLRIYEQKGAEEQIPVIRALSMRREAIAARAAGLAHRIASATGGALTPNLENGESVVGGGSAPGVGLPTVLVSLQHPVLSAARIEEHLRRNRIPIIVRTERDRVLIDLRTVMPDEENILLEAITALGRATPGPVRSAGE
jgi:L-seryl-tRNA(Ser) seleniumtransferase